MTIYGPDGMSLTRMVSQSCLFLSEEWFILFPTLRTPRRRCRLRRIPAASSGIAIHSKSWLNSVANLDTSPSSYLLSMICQEYKNNGACSMGDQCKFSHYIEFCHICNVVLSTQRAYWTHQRGKRHLTRLFHAGVAVDGMCIVCSEPYGPPNIPSQFISHAQGQHHQKLAMLDPQIENVRHDVEARPANAAYCRTCNTNVPYHSWGSHLAGRRHRIAQTFHQVNGVFQSMSQNRHYVEVSGDESGVDFGVVSPSTAGVATTIKISLTAPEDIYLLDACLLSSSGRHRSSGSSL